MKEWPSPVPLKGVSMSRDVTLATLRQDAVCVCLLAHCYLGRWVTGQPGSGWLSARVEPSLNCLPPGPLVPLEGCLGRRQAACGCGCLWTAVPGSWRRHGGTWFSRRQCDHPPPVKPAGLQNVSPWLRLCRASMALAWLGLQVSPELDTKSDNAEGREECRGGKNRHFFWFSWENKCLCVCPEVSEDSAKGRESFPFFPRSQLDHCDGLVDQGAHRWARVESGCGG